MNLYLLHYNNYYNKILKREETIEDYIALDAGKVGDEPRVILGAVSDVNFNPNNNLDTEQIINWSWQDPDYVIAVADTGEIVSRWFVIDSVRTRGGQYNMSLHRDTLADFRDEVLNSKAYIKRAVIPSTSPLIYNSEGMQFNQIKQKEDLLFDKTGKPWIVGYVAPNATTLKDAAIVFQGNNAPLTNYQELLAYTRTPIQVVSGTPYLDVWVRSTKYWKKGINITQHYYGWRYRIQPGNATTIIDTTDDLGTGRNAFQATTDDSGTVQNSLTSTFRNRAINLQDIIARYKSVLASNTYQQYNGQVVQDIENNKYYRVVVESAGTSTQYVAPRATDAETNAFYQELEAQINADPYIQSISKGKGTYAEATLYVGYTVQTYRLTLIPIIYGDVSINFSSSSQKRKLHDAPYYMFAMPYSERNYQLAIQINTDNSQFIYDIQILPYCPVQDYYTGRGKPNLSGLVEHKDYEKIIVGSSTSLEIVKRERFSGGKTYLGANNHYPYEWNVQYFVYIGGQRYDLRLDSEASGGDDDYYFYIVGNDSYNGELDIYQEVTSTQSGGDDDILFWCTKSVFTFDIPYTINVQNIKESNECDLYRICSPNGNGVFEFNAAKNAGVRLINVDCTYRPFDPYIHLNPDFNNLYGEDFNDFRGLVLNGDFSIPALNDRWIEYITYNKNYQNIFDREIQSMELQNKIAKQTDIWSAIAGVFGAGIQGGATGALVAGPYGALAGLGTAGLSAIGAGIDLRNNAKLRAEQINLKRDLFSYNLQNIQAAPVSITKTGCLTNNNKMVPFIEYYTCTDEEKEILALKLKYTGMTVGAVGRVGDFVVVGSGENNAKYIEADIIEMDIPEDYHISMDIAKELSSGIRVA